MTDCTLRPQSFLILQPSQTTNTHVSPKSTISGWPRQSPSLLTPGSLPHSHCCYSGGIPVTGLLESPLATSLPPAVPPLQPSRRCRRDTSGLETHGGSLSHCQSLTFLAGPLSPGITCPNLSAFAQPFLILLTLNQPTSLLNWLNFFFLSFHAFFHASA